MTAVQSRQRAALLCRTALPALILAVVAGILGMHVITGNHAAHTLGAAARAVVRCRTRHRAQPRRTDPWRPQVRPC